MEKALLSGGSGKVKETWENGKNNLKFDKDYPYGYPWPPRSYTCSFCQREFKSAQALGGHMNIHRRDRARLRDQSDLNNPNPSLLAHNSIDQPPNPNPNQNPNPNPNDHPNNNHIANFPPSSPPPNHNVYAHQYSLVSLSLSSLPPSIKNGEKIVDMGRDFDQGLGMCKDFDHQELRVLKNTTHHHSNKEVVKLDLELCLGEAKQELDLELRLGI